MIHNHHYIQWRNGMSSSCAWRLDIPICVNAITGLVARRHDRSADIFVTNGYVKKWMYPKPVKTREEKEKRIIRERRDSRMGICTILREHRSDLLNDPDRLTTSFIKKLAKIDECNDIMD